MAGAKEGSDLLPTDKQINEGAVRNKTIKWFVIYEQGLLSAN